MIHSILFHSTIFIIQNIRNAIVIYDFLKWMYQKLPVEKNVYMYDKMGMVLTQSVCQ